MAIQPNGPIENTVYGRPTIVTTNVFGNTHKEVVVPVYDIGHVQVTFTQVTDIHGTTTTLDKVVQRDTQYIERPRFESHFTTFSKV